MSGMSTCRESRGDAAHSEMRRCSCVSYLKRLTTQAITYASPASNYEFLLIDSSDSIQKSLPLVSRIICNNQMMLEMLGGQEHEVNKYSGLDICGDTIEQRRELSTSATTYVGNGDFYDTSYQADPNNLDLPASSNPNPQTKSLYSSYDVQSHSTPGSPQPTAQTSSVLLSTARLLSATEPGISLFLMRLASSDLALAIIGTWLDLSNSTGDSVSDVLSAATDYTREMNAAMVVLSELATSEEAIAGILRRMEHDPQLDLRRILTVVGDYLFYDLNSVITGSIMYTLAGDSGTIYRILAIIPEPKETRSLPECVRQVLTATAGHLSRIEMRTAGILDETADAQHADNNVDESGLDKLPLDMTEPLSSGMASDPGVNGMAGEQNAVSQTQQQGYLDLDNPGEESPSEEVIPGLSGQGYLKPNDTSGFAVLHQGSVLHSQHDQGKELPLFLTAETSFQQHGLQQQQIHLDSNDSLSFVSKSSLERSILQTNQDYVDHTNMSSKLLSQQDDLQPQLNCPNYNGLSAGSTLLKSTHGLSQDPLGAQYPENDNLIPECPSLSIMAGLNTQPQQSNPDSLNFVEGLSLSDIPTESLWDQVEWLPQQDHLETRNFAVDSSATSTTSEPSASNQHDTSPTIPALSQAPTFPMATPVLSQPVIHSPTTDEARVHRYHNAHSVLTRLCNGDPLITDPVAGMYILGQALGPVMTSWNQAPQWIDDGDNALDEVKLLILELRRKLIDQYTLGTNGNGKIDQMKTGLLRSRRVKKEQTEIGPLWPRHRSGRKGDDHDSGPSQNCSPRYSVATLTTPTVSCPTLSTRGPNWSKLLQRTLLDFWLQHDGRHPGPEDRERLLRVTGLKSRQLTDWYGRTCQRRGDDLERYRLWSRQYPDSVYDWESYAAFKSEMDGKGKMGRKKRKNS